MPRFLARAGLVMMAGLVGISASAAFAFIADLSDGLSIWYLARASGFVAYTLLALSTIGGLLTSSRLLMRWVKLPLTLEVHQTLSLIGLAAIGFHGWVLLFDREFGFGLAEVLLPFASPYRHLAVASGMAAAYLAFVISVSFYVRQWLGQRTWRVMHYATFVTFFLMMAHGVWSGSDSSSVAAVWLYASSGFVMLFLTYARILGGRYVPKRASNHHKRMPGPVAARMNLTGTMADRRQRSPHKPAVSDVATPG